MLKTFGRVQLLKAHEPASIGWIAFDGITHKPARKHGRSDLWRLATRVPKIDWRRAQLRVAAGRQPIIVLEPQAQQSREAWLLNQTERVAALIPVIESHDQYRSLGQVQHRPGTVVANELAESDLIFGHDGLRLR